MAIIDLTDLKGPEGADNTPGIKGNIYAAPEEWFTTIAAVSDTPAAPGDTVTIATDHAFDLTKGFLQLYSTLDSGEVVMEPVGERDGRGQRATLEFFNPGNTPAAAEFARHAKNRSWIILVETMDGTIQQIGSKGLGAEIVTSYNSGKLSGGRRGFTYKAEAYQNGIQLYTGAITLKP